MDNSYVSPVIRIIWLLPVLFYCTLSWIIMLCLQTCLVCLTFFRFNLRNSVRGTSQNMKIVSLGTEVFPIKSLFIYHTYLMDLRPTLRTSENLPATHLVTFDSGFSVSIKHAFDIAPCSQQGQNPVDKLKYV